MKTVKIENVCVNAEGAWSAKMRFSLHWEQPGCRYHVWCDAGHKPSDTMYKNPPHGVEHHEPGDFDTRHLRASAKANAEMLAVAIFVANRDSLWQKALDKVKAETLHENADKIRMAIDSNQRSNFNGRIVAALTAIVVAAERAQDLEQHIIEGRSTLDALKPDAEQISARGASYTATPLLMHL